MKKYLLFLLAFSFVFSTAQCTITGVDKIQVGERQNFTVEVSGDLSASSYQWNYLDQKVIPQGDLNTKTLNVKGSVPGKSVLSATAKINSDTFTCQKSIEVIAPLSISIETNAIKCTIAVDEFKERRVSNNTVSFEPNLIESGYSNQWTVTYRSGIKKMSSDTKGTFDFSNENVIDKVELKILAKQCTKTITRTYNNYFWWFF